MPAATGYVYQKQNVRCGIVKCNGLMLSSSDAALSCDEVSEVVEIIPLLGYW